MTQARRRITLIILIACLTPITTIQASESQQAISTIKKMIGFIRYKKNEKALRYIGVQQISQFMLGKNYTKITPAQKTKFHWQVGKFIELRAFPQAYKYFKDIDLSFDKPKIKGRKAQVKSSLLYAGSEQMIFTWVLTKVGNKYLVTDFLNEKGVSSMKTNRDRQVLPLYKKQGMPGVLDRFDKLIKKLEN